MTTRETPVKANLCQYLAEGSSRLVQRQPPGLCLYPSPSLQRV